MITESIDSDIEVVVDITDSHGGVLDPLTTTIGWQVKSRSAYNSKGSLYEGGVKDGVCTNCYIVDGRLVLTLPSRTFSEGVLYLRVMTSEENDHFNDGTKDVWGEWLNLNVKLE